MISSMRVVLFGFLLLLSHQQIVKAQNTTFNIAVVVDQYLKYAPYDLLIFQGVTWWQEWVNARGGLFYAGSYHQVEVYTEDASSQNSNLTYSNVYNAYVSMVQNHNINLIVSPYTSERSSAAIAVSERFGIVNLVPNALLDSLFKNASAYTFGNAVRSSLLPQTILKVLVDKGIKNYVMIRRPDSISMAFGQGAIDYLAANGVRPLNVTWLNTSSTDVSLIATGLRGVMSQTLNNIETDAFIYAGANTEFSVLTSVFNDLKPDVKSASLLSVLSRFQAATDQLGDVPDYWITSTRFDQDFNFGVSGQLGGTTAEFVANFTARFGHPPSSSDATTPGLLMTYYVALNQTQSVDSTLMRNTMKSMGTVNTFATPFKFSVNGTNELGLMQVLQFVNGMGRLTTSENIVYPAPFHKSESKFNKILIIEIVVPIGVVIIALIVFGARYMQHQRQQAVKALVQAEEGERRNYRIDYSSLQFAEPIGTGGFGVVFRGEYRGADVAIKKLKTQVMTKTQLEEFAKESAVMIGLRHPNILLFMGVCLEPPELAIITEFMPRGSLFDIIHNDRINLPFALIKNMAIDILKGLHFIHSAGIIHRDLKSPNLLVDKSWNIKIADFGLSVMKSESNDDAQVSLLWTAPEILMKQADCYSDKSDVYSFGIILWELMSRKMPFDSYVAAAVSPAVVGGQRPPIDSKWDEQIGSLISMCWAASPFARPTVKEARAHLERIYADPDFEVGSSSSLQNYVDKVKPPVGNITFVFTCVCDTSQLWDHDPHVMMQSLILHNQIMRDLMNKHSGFEVKSNGDSFLLAFGESVNAINFCLAAQNSLLNAEWPPILLKHSCASEHKNSVGDIIFRGLTVNMGIHATTATLERTSGTSEVSYYSPDISIAQQLSTFAGKGCAVLAADMYAKVMGVGKLSPFSIHSLGTKVVLDKEINLYQILSDQLEGRESPTPNDTTPLPTTRTSQLVKSTSQFRFPDGQERWLVKYEDLQIGEKIGAGSFGEVNTGIYNGQKVAIKQLFKQKMNEVGLLEMRTESAILRSVTHPNVISFVGACLRLPNLCLITEYMEKGSLSNLLYPANGHCTLTWDQKKKMTIDMAKGLQYLHNIGIIHRDIKSSNMLVANDFTVKIADFGFSRMKAGNQTMTQVGTVSYSAPEVFEGMHYTDKADVYSFGIVLWEVIFNKKPWDAMHAMKIVAAVTSGSRPPVTSLPHGTPPGMVHVMQACWDHNQENRPSFKEILDELEHA